MRSGAVAQVRMVKKAGKSGGVGGGGEWWSVEDLCGLGCLGREGGLLGSVGG